MNPRTALWLRFDTSCGSSGFGTLEAADVVVHDGDMFAGAEPTGELLPLANVAVIAPVRPTKVIGLWNNLRAAAERNGWPTPTEPLYFFKPPSSVVGHGAPVVKPASYRGRVLYEGELGVVIGKDCTNVSVEDVDEVVFGYTCVNDVTAVDLIGEDASFAQWCRAKGFDSFAPIGPVIAAGIEPDVLRVETTVGGKLRQSYSVDDMFFSPRDLVSLISRDMTLRAGDVIACGTSLGAMPMREGVPISVAIEGIGVLTNALGD